jgi:hypothetical protein
MLAFNSFGQAVSMTFGPDELKIQKFAEQNILSGKTGKKHNNITHKLQII